MDDTVGENLIRQLVSDASEFAASGQAYDLLQRYFDGFPLETLRPLLCNADEVVRRSAVWITSELGGAAQPLLPSVVSLAADEDRSIRYYTLEILTVCARGEHAKAFYYVIRSLQDRDEVVRRLAMRLVSRADAVQLEVGMGLFDLRDPVDTLHRQGLFALLRGHALGFDSLHAMIESEQALTRRYGVIALKRGIGRFSELVAEALASRDPDVRLFAKEELENPT